MNEVRLDYGWRLRALVDEDKAPEELRRLNEKGIITSVPCSVYDDLIENSLLDDPYYRDNELHALKLMEYDYEYSIGFCVDENISSCDKVMLRFDGIDTLSDIYLNDVHLGHTCNMHRVWEYDVKDSLIAGENILKVVLHSPTKYIKEENAKDPIPGTTDAMAGFPYLRKAHCMFGWDWGPRLPDAGIWKKVSLIGYNEARFDGVYIRQKHEEDKVHLDFEIDIEKAFEADIKRYGADDRDMADIRITADIICPDGECFHVEGEKLLEGVDIASPKLWWPNGYGEQPLYKVIISLFDAEGEMLDVFERRIGLRTMTISREKDEYGESFCHEVNGVKVFAMGADYIPEDNILPRINKERTYKLLEQAKLANHNCIRVWGGGLYAGDDFYDVCDELGLMVWQDFMFACAVYNLTEEFEENITAEFIDNIKRIRNHASLGLWCGNNEMEMFVLEGGMWVNKPSQRSDYVKMYEYIIPKLLKKYDPDTFYWPASPSSGGAFDEPNAENRGDVHYWDVWHGNKPITEYRKFYFRYVSEFGFQSFPGLKSCESFTLPEDRNIFSYVMEKHQRNSSANGKIMNYMEQTFLYPTSFDAVLYASQLLQAQAMRYGVEHFRRNRGRCMGAVIWQLNDCWPTASWSSIDYFGRWKALHYYEKRFFAPVLLSCAEEGILTQDTNPNAEPYEVKKSIQLCVANESMRDEVLTVRWALRDASAHITRQDECEVTVPALSSVWLDKVDMPDAKLYENYVSYDCFRGEEYVSGGTVLFSAPKHFRYKNPNLKVELDGDEIVITADAYAASVEILNDNEDMILSDNYFDMNAGTRRVKILEGEPTGLRVRSVYDIS